MGFRKLQGAREEMEDDAVIVCSSPHNDLDGFFFAAVFDGHTGFSSVNFLRDCFFFVRCFAISVSLYHKAAERRQVLSFYFDYKSLLKNAMKNYNYDDDPLLAPCVITIERQLAQVEGPVLQAPKLKVGNREDISPLMEEDPQNRKFGPVLRVENCYNSNARQR
ncbi:unnamed protein product [Lactuca virosa]|uniref:Protein-serine/threonine phosphatase n=1 Tax=Lactuca virosa TaxID=75947 RepID=A0AAU9MI82_9ASTR|nr:unnamed protein product [Lactuca virosa]